MEQTVYRAAAGLGLLVRWLVLGVQYVVLTAPIAAVVYGVYLIYMPAAWIVGGSIAGFLLYRPKGRQ